MIRGGNYFEYAGKSSSDYDLILYFLSDPGGSYEEPLYTVDLIEDRLLTKHSPIYYGKTDNNNAIAREVVFGFTTPCDSRDVIDEIASWLTNVDGYEKLIIEQDDLSDYYYLCSFQNLQLISNSLPYAFRATMVMYDQFAHEGVLSNAYEVVNGVIKMANGVTAEEIKIDNNSSLHGYTYPKITLTIPSACDSLSIINHTDINGNRPFIFTGLSALATNDGSDLIIEIDNERRIIDSPNCANKRGLYKAFGDKDTHYHYFFRLLNGENKISFSGSGTVKFEHEVLRKVAM